MSQVRATKEKATFRQAVSVSAEIAAPAERVWGLLTSVAAQRDWNSTLVSIDGAIEEGAVVVVVAHSDPKRTFKLKVSDVVADRSMAWSDGNLMFRGVRTFELQPTDMGVRFEMREEFSGWMLPMISGSLPDFVPVFETYANDLKRAAEQGREETP